MLRKVTEKPTQFKDLKSLPDRHGLGEKKEKSKTGSEKIKIKVKVENNLESLPKKVQQEQVLRGKVQLWDHFFTTEQAVMKRSPEDTTKTGQGQEIRIPTTPNQTKKEGNILRGQNSLKGKRAKHVFVQYPTPKKL